MAGLEEQSPDRLSDNANNINHAPETGQARGAAFNNDAPSSHPSSRSPAASAVRVALFAFVALARRPLARHP